MSNKLIQEHKYHMTLKLHRGSYMGVHVVLNLLNKLGKRDKMRGLPSILSLLSNKFKISIIQEHECKILFII